MAKYPGHVEKVIFLAPASIWNLSQYKYDYARTEGGKEGIPTLRLLAAFLLEDRNPEAAQNLVPQREAEELLVPVIAPTVGQLVCKGDRGALPSYLANMTNERHSPDANPYVSLLLADLENPAEDPHSALRGNNTPAILLFPECDFISWDSTIDYRKTLANLKVYYIPRAGHYILFEQPELMKRVMVSFLTGQPDAIPPYTSDADPRTGHP